MHKAHELAAGALVPTRLVNLATVAGGLSSDAQRSAVDEGASCCKCNTRFDEPSASSPGSRVIVNGCCHSYCKTCISGLPPPE